MRPRPQTLLLLFLLALFAFHLALMGQIPISPDEAYYWCWSRRLAPSYYDAPGMIAWIHGLVSLFLPNASAFTVRLPAAVLAFATAWVLYRAYRVLYDDEAEAVALVLALSILPIAFIGSFISIYDNPLLFLLALGYLFMFQLLRRPRAYLWYLISLALAAGLYCKISALMPAGCFVLFALLSPTLRPELRRPHPYLAALLALALLVPFLVWNSRHDWVTVLAVSRITRVGEITLADRLSFVGDFLLSQLAAYSPLILISLVAALISAARSSWKERDESQLLLLMLSVPILAYFLLQSFRSHVLGNWPVVGFVPALILTARIAAAGGAAAFRGAADPSREPVYFRRSYLCAGLAFALLLSLGPVLQARYRLAAPLLRRVEKILRLDYRIDQRLDQELSGWSELSAAVEEHRAGADFILARKYQLAAELEFYLPDHPQVLVYSAGLRRSQFDLWTDLKPHQGQTALFVDDHRIPPALAEQFDRVIPLAAPLRIMDQGEQVKRFFIYRGEGFHPR